MQVDSSFDSKPVKRKKSRKSQLRVVFDTNALYVTSTSLGSASDLVRQEITDVISDSKYPDLDILWYLPEVVRHERQYQMQAEALKLRPAINRIERLLGHNLALTDQTLLDHVKTKIDEKEKQLGLQEIALDHTLIDWGALIHAAQYRIPPFHVGEKEKGFRDSLVAESFLQLLASSPKTPSVCRVVLVTSDELLTQAVKERIADAANASVLASVEELKGLINTVVSNVGEDFIAQLKPKAAKLFFVSADDKSTLYYTEKITKQIHEKFALQLKAKPPGTAFRTTERWYINRPNFSRKEAKNIFWTSRIEAGVEFGTVVRVEEPNRLITYSGGLTTQPEKAKSVPLNVFDTAYAFPPLTTPGFQPFDLEAYTFVDPSEKRIVTHKGRDIFEVLWSTEVTMKKELRKAAIVEIRHVELKWQLIS